VATKTDALLRLRTETAPLHRAVEEAVGLPDAVQSREDYAALLGRLLVFHTAVEAEFGRPRWRDDWAAAGIVVADHARTSLLASDLRALGAPPAEATITLAPFETFGEVLGSLYVTEGSSLGGRIIGPAIAARLGSIPTRFYESDGREHPHPWRAVQVALGRFDEGGGDLDDVLAGATVTFRAFGDYLDRSTWVSTP
jgi:heme oxygenase